MSKNRKTSYGKMSTIESARSVMLIFIYFSRKGEISMITAVLNTQANMLFSDCPRYRGNEKGKKAPHCYLPRFMDDDDPAERELGLSFGLRLLCECRELWRFGARVSDGMKREIDAARQRRIKIRHFTDNCEEVMECSRR